MTKPTNQTCSDRSNPLNKFDKISFQGRFHVYKENAVQTTSLQLALLSIQWMYLEVRLAIYVGLFCSSKSTKWCFWWSSSYEHPQVSAMCTYCHLHRLKQMFKKINYSRLKHALGFIFNVFRKLSPLVFRGGKFIKPYLNGHISLSSNKI